MHAFRYQAKPETICPLLPPKRGRWWQLWRPPEPQRCVGAGCHHWREITGYDRTAQEEVRGWDCALAWQYKLQATTQGFMETLAAELNQSNNIAHAALIALGIRVPQPAIVARQGDRLVGINAMSGRLSEIESTREPE